MKLIALLVVLASFNAQASTLSCQLTKNSEAPVTSAAVTIGDQPFQGAFYVANAETAPIAIDGYYCSGTAIKDQGSSSDGSPTVVTKVMAALWRPNGRLVMSDFAPDQSVANESFGPNLQFSCVCAIQR